MGISSDKTIRIDQSDHKWGEIENEFLHELLN